MTTPDRDASPPWIDDPAIFRKVLLHSTDSIVITDERGRIVLANDAWLRLYGYTIDEVRGQTTRLIRSPHSTPEMYGYMWSRISDPAQGFWKGEIVNRKKSGEEVAVLLTITPIRREDDTIAGYMGIGIDVTEQRRAEEMREIYSMVIRHDLKAPLASILALVGTILEGYAGEVPAKQRDILERTRRAGLRMEDMIATSLDLEKMKRGTLRLSPADTDLYESVRESAGTLADLADRKRVIVSVRTAGHVATEDDRLIIETDPIHLQRCLDNLLKNAIEAAPDGSLVLVSVERREEDDSARIAFHNEGPPIPPDVRATLFHPFSTYGKRGGTGLGVFGVKMTVEAMGGTIRHESDARGTTFEITLPLRPLRSTMEGPDNS